MERRNWEIHGGRLSDKMAVKRLNAMGIEAKSWYDKGKESKSDMSSQAPIEGNFNQGREGSKQHGHYFNSFFNRFMFSSPRLRICSGTYYLSNT